MDAVSRELDASATSADSKGSDPKVRFDLSDEPDDGARKVPKHLMRTLARLREACEYENTYGYHRLTEKEVRGWAVTWADDPELAESQFTPVFGKGLWFSPEPIEAALNRMEMACYLTSSVRALLGLSNKCIFSPTARDRLLAFVAAQRTRLARTKSERREQRKQEREANKERAQQTAALETETKAKEPCGERTWGGCCRRRRSDSQSDPLYLGAYP